MLSRVSEPPVLLHGCLDMDNAMMNAREQDTSWVTKITLLNLGSPNAIPMGAQFCIPMTTPFYSLLHFLDYSSTCTVMILGLSSLEKLCVESLQWAVLSLQLLTLTSRQESSL